MHSSSIILLALSASSALAGQWGVYLYTDRSCEKQTAQWRDDQPSGCTNLEGYPDILAIKTDTPELNSRCGWGIQTFDKLNCGGTSRFLDINDYCQDVPTLGDFNKPTKSFGVFKNGGC